MIILKPDLDLKLNIKRALDYFIVSEEAEKRSEEFYDKVFYECRLEYFLRYYAKALYAGSETHGSRAIMEFFDVLDGNRKVLEKLPENILCKVADMRVFTLGYVSEEVKSLLKSY